MNLPKVLVCSPTASAKNYCLEDFAKNVNSFTYPNYETYFVDNTLGSNINTEHIKTYGLNSVHCNSLSNSVIERMAISHQMCANYALENNFDYILHLETDVFPSTDIIQKLLKHNKKVVGALYYRDEGKFRKLMIQNIVKVSKDRVEAINMLPEEDVFFIDGSLKAVASIGLGCVLIKKEVLQKIKFRFEVGKDMHPDSFFSEDCFKNRINIFADTSIICEHRNKAWGKYGIDFK